MLLCRSRREYNRESKLIEKCEPERIVFVHIQYTRDTDHTAFCRSFRQWFIIKITLLICIQIRFGSLFSDFAFAKSAFAAVSGNKLTSAAEMIDRQTTVICTAFTFCHSCRIFHGLNVLNGEHSRAFAVYITFSVQ